MGSVGNPVIGKHSITISGPVRPSGDPDLARVRAESTSAAARLPISVSLSPNVEQANEESHASGGANQPLRIEVIIHFCVAPMIPFCNVGAFRVSRT